MEKLSFKEKAGFSIGELAGSGLWQIMIIFLPIFYTDTFGIPAAVVGTMFLVVRIFDAINDPIIGAIADRTSTKHGKFRPYLVGVSVPFALVTMAMFWGPDFSMNGKIVYAYATYILMSIVYTSAMIPFSALSGVMTSNRIERTSLNSFRFFTAFVASMMVQGLVRPSVSFFGGGNDTVGYRYTMIIFGVICIFAFLVAFAGTKERIKPTSDTPNKLKDDLGDLFKNTPWVIILVVSLLTLIFISIRSAVQTYYFKYYIGAEDMVSSFMVIGTAATLVGVVVTPFLVKLLDKKKLYLICIAVIGVSSLFFYIAGPEDLALIYAVQIIFSFANGPTMPLLWSMMADAADYSEWKNNRRATGLVFSASTMAQKAGGALGGAIAMWLLAYYGFIANAPQTEMTLTGMRLMLSVWPAVFALVSIGILVFYKLDAQTMEQIETELTARKNAQGS